MSKILLIGQLILACLLQAIVIISIVAHAIKGTLFSFGGLIIAAMFFILTSLFVRASWQELRQQR